MIAMVFIAFSLALFNQVRSAAFREAALEQQLRESRSGAFTLEVMHLLLSDRGIEILKQASDVEVLRVSWLPDEYDVEVAPTGVMLGEAMAAKVACALMDHRNYRPGHREPFMDSSPPPPPLVGLRFRRGGILDVLVEPGFSETALGEVRFKIYDQEGKIVHSYESPIDICNPELQRVIKRLSRQKNPGK
ncbi:hypothetical protein [Paludisphaera rhizosphaerae]|nr:hypothetical protein [Paludisphaera rhizosphaerae]